MALDSTKNYPGLPLNEEGNGINTGLRSFKQEIFSIGANSSAGKTIPWKNPSEGGRAYTVYGNCNFSIYSAAPCNGNCPFCVEKLRPLSRGCTLDKQKKGTDDESYFRALERALKLVKPLDPSVSITGGEPSLDPRLPRIIALLKHHDSRKRTITTNGSGLLRNKHLESLIAGGFSHLNLSRAHFNEEMNQAFMRLEPFMTNKDLYSVISMVRGTNLRPRLSCVLLKNGIHGLDGIIDYLEWAASIGVDNVVFRQLMNFNRQTYLQDPVVDYSERNRVDIAEILGKICTGSGDCLPRFGFTKQVLGYYYYVEVYKYKSKVGRMIDVIFEEANLAFIDRDKGKQRDVPVIHEFVFHPGGTLCSTWQPWDGILVP